MNIFKSCKDRLFDWNNSDFEELAMDIYHFQATHNQVYREYHQYLEIDHRDVVNSSGIPFLPIEFFKTRKVITQEWSPEVVFRSSGTTGDRSEHFIRDLDLYREISLRNFEMFFGAVRDYHIMALLPSYLERNDSSLVFMTDHLIRSSGKRYSGFYLDNLDQLSEDLRSVRSRGEKLILMGVSFALLDLAATYPMDLGSVIIVETGGMKGRREELTREVLHDQLKKAFEVDRICSEYGMTELLSQAYSLGEGKFKAPPWMKIVIREINDPFTTVSDGTSGGLNIMDLSNIHSCSFIETKDIGKKTGAENFEVLGRYDNSDIRGCNLLIN